MVFTRRSKGFVIALAVLVWIGPAHALPGFVSGELLTSWCSRNESLDREACYSYLRGASDAFHAVADVSAAANRGRNMAPWPNQCMPARISITELRDLFLAFAANEPHRLDLQAAVLLAEVLSEAFPCAAISRPDP